MGETERVIDKAFSNGDVYVGDCLGVLPHGKGKYTWSDNTVYEGDWEHGKMTGKGQLLWSSGAKYEGDFSGGYLHGSGIFAAPDGSIYKGSWRLNSWHGVGRKEYINSDVYDGSWEEGVQEGNGSYFWNTGNTYIGNWKSGKMCGKGVMKWENGDIFYGCWLNGLRHGSGVYKFGDGGYYFGMWTAGLKDGKGTFYPSGTKHPSINKFTHSLRHESMPRRSSIKLEGFRIPKPVVKRPFSDKISMSGHSGRISHRGGIPLDENLSLLVPSEEFIGHGSSSKSPEPQNEGSALVYEREYMQGVLTRERVRNCADLSCKTKQQTFTKKNEKISYLGIFRRNRSYYLMLNLQLGIRYTVGKITPVPRRDVRLSDFGDQARIRMFFPRKGSRFTPSHKSIDFGWKDYCPMVFRNLREMFKLDAAEYMMSICGDDGLREISSPGKSGSLFYLSHDDRFVIKTLRVSELKVLLKMLPSYYRHVGDHENTLITKFFGVHRITLKGGNKVRFVVMGNMFCTELRIHRRYDLKGSSHGRFTPKNKIEENTTLKDLDLSYEFHMDKLLRESLFDQISLDCKFLESQNIIDYSLLLGLHFRAPEQQLNGLLDPPSEITDQESLLVREGGSSQGNLLIPPKGLLLVTHEPSVVNTAPGPHIRGSTLRAYSVGAREVDLILPGTARLRVQLGVNMPAQANHKLVQDKVDSTDAELFEIYDVVLYMGIIDILQDYNMKKKAEHAWKSLRHEPMSISAVEPELYANRFFTFLQNVFAANHA